MLIKDLLNIVMTTKYEDVLNKLNEALKNLSGKYDFKFEEVKITNVMNATKQQQAVYALENKNRIKYSMLFVKASLKEKNHGTYRLFADFAKTNWVSSVPVMTLRTKGKKLSEVEKEINLALENWFMEEQDRFIINDLREKYEIFLEKVSSQCSFDFLGSTLDRRHVVDIYTNYLKKMATEYTESVNELDDLCNRVNPEEIREFIIIPELIGVALENENVERELEAVWSLNQREERQDLMSQLDKLENYANTEENRKQRKELNKEIEKTYEDRGKDSFKKTIRPVVKLSIVRSVVDSVKKIASYYVNLDALTEDVRRRLSDGAPLSEEEAVFLSNLDRKKAFAEAEIEQLDTRWSVKTIRQDQENVALQKVRELVLRALEDNNFSRKLIEAKIDDSSGPWFAEKMKGYLDEIITKEMSGE